MSATPLVSIITPSLNQGQFIEDTIRSIVAQDYPRIEHIVRDGGSMDETVDILERYRRAGTLSYTSGPDGGQAAAINEGFAACQGEIVTWLNSDDVYVFSDAVSTMVRAFVEHPEDDFIYGDYVVMDAEGTVQCVFPRPRFSRARLLRLSYIAQPATFFRRRVIEQFKLDPTLRIALDLEYFLRASGAGCRFRHIPKIVAAERMHAAAKCVSEVPRMQAESWDVRERYGYRPDWRRPLLHMADKIVLGVHGLRGLRPWWRGAGGAPLAVPLRRPSLIKRWLYQLRLLRNAAWGTAPRPPEQRHRAPARPARVQPIAQTRDEGEWFLNSAIGGADGHYVAFYRNSSRGPVYGEMTAYAISMGCIWYRRTGDARYLERARRAAAYLLEVARPAMRGPLDGRVYTFDTAILASGLLDLFAVTKDEGYRAEAQHRLEWLLEHSGDDGAPPATVHPVDEEGPASWGNWPLRRSVHLAKIAVPLLKGWRVTQDERYRATARRLVEWAVGLQGPDGRFAIGPGGVSGNGAAPATLTHPHCYATEALLYADWAAPEFGLCESLRRASDWLARAQNSDGSFDRWYGPGPRLVRTKASDATAQALRIWRVLGVHEDRAARADEYLRSIVAPDGGLPNNVRHVGPLRWREKRIFAWPTFFWHHAGGIRFGDTEAASEIF
jgi:hypothetical protein